MQSLKLRDFQIKPFEFAYQDGVQKLILPIQQVEFKVGITLSEQPELMDIRSGFITVGGNFWVALANGEVVGSIGILPFSQTAVALRKMFVRKDFRGKENGVAGSLMNEAKMWCVSQGFTDIYLGTVSVMAAAHRFYLKNGFEEIVKQERPGDFPPVHVDNKFFHYSLLPNSD